MNIDENQWVESMRKSIVEHEEEEEEEDENSGVCIFTVPQVLVATDPEYYIPQVIALGPFHHFRPEVFDMQRYKLAAAKRIQKHMNCSFEVLVETMKQRDEARLRRCYDKILDMTGDELIWMMAVDMAFLLEFLQVYSMKEEGRVLDRVTSSMSHLVDGSGKKLSHMAILRDLVMVENQIPLFLIKTMLEHQYGADQERSAEEKLKKMLMGLYQDQFTPFKENELPDLIVNDCHHLLDFLYRLTVHKNNELGIMEAEIDIKEEEDIGEENTIPSVTEMAQAGIQFSPVKGGISDIRFDHKKSTLYLPVVELDVNTEVFFRNLVAYEACVAAGPLVVAQYTELMNRMIKTKDDAKYLRERGIVLNHLKSDKEVADLWGRMSKSSVKLTKVPKMDKLIEDMNKRYAQTWGVKFENFMNTYVFGSWKFLLVLAVLILLILTGLKAFCSVFKCVRVPVNQEQCRRG